MRRDVDDRSASTDAHPVSSLAGTDEWTGQVDRPEPFHRMGRIGVEGSVAPRDAGVVDQYIETPTALVDLGKHGEYVALVSDIGPHSERLVSDLGGQSLGHVGTGRVVDDDGVASCRGEAGNCGADAAAGSRHEH